MTSRLYAADMKVAIQGELGSFSHAAALEMLPRAQVVPCAASRDVFESVSRRKVDAAVIPIENSLAGPVAEHLDLLLSSELWIGREFRLRIEHNLISAPGVALKEVRRVFSHPVALAQCRELFRKHRQMRPEPFYDTAGAVRHVISGELRDAAAIAGLAAANQYEGKILLRGIEDDSQNFTRFFLVTRREKKNMIARGADKTSVAFALRNAPGALFKALSVFALRNIDLSKIESRPIPGRPWEYVFYVDLLRGDDEAARSALDNLREYAEFVKVLGVYKGHR